MLDIIDERDKKILSILDMDGRISLSELAKRLRVSKQAAQYRLNQLLQKKIIRGFYAVIDNTKLGYFYVRLVVTLQNSPPRIQQEIIKSAKQITGVGWVIEADAAWDLGFVLYAKDPIDTKRIVDEILRIHGRHIRNYVVSYATYVHHFQNRFLSRKEDGDSFIVGGSLNQNKIDEIDYKILVLLSKDGRASATDISKKIGESYKVVIYRMRILEQKAIIRCYRADINYAAFGCVVKKVFITLRNVSPLILTKLKETIKKNPNAIYITEALGFAELECEIIETSYEDLKAFLDRLRTDFSEFIVDIKTHLIYNYQTINYLPIAREN